MYCGAVVLSNSPVPFRKACFLMVRISRSALLPYSATRIFALVDDIALYPEFMQGCVSAEILERVPASVTARLTLGKAGLRYAFTTCNVLEPPHCMQMQLVEGPFRVFNAQWRFLELSPAACKVSFEIEFEFSAKLVDKVLTGLFENTASEMVNAIAKRAEQLYGCQ